MSGRRSRDDGPLAGTTRRRPDHRLASALLRALVPDVASRVAVLATSLVAARALDPARFAEFLALLAAGVLAAVVWDAGTSVLLQRDIASGRVGAGRGARQAFRLRIVVLPAWALVFGGSIVLLQRLFDPDTVTVLSFACASIASGLRLIPGAVLQAEMRFLRASGSVAVGRWLTTALALVALSVAEPDRLHVLALAVLFGELASLLIAAALVRGAAVEVLESRPGNQISLRRALPFAANSVMVQAYNRFDILVVAALTTATQIGAYAPASRLQDALYVLPAGFGVVGLSLLSRAYASPGNDEYARRLAGRLVTVGILVAIPIAATVSVFAPTLIRIVLGEEYLDSVTPVRIMAWSIVGSAFVAPLLASLAAVNRAADTTKVYGATLAAALTLHLSLDWWAGATGAAIASLGRDVAAVIVCYHLARRAGVMPAGLAMPWLPARAEAIKSR